MYTRIATLVLIFTFLFVLAGWRVLGPTHTTQKFQFNVVDIEASDELCITTDGVLAHDPGVICTGVGNFDHWSYPVSLGAPGYLVRGICTTAQSAGWDADDAVEICPYEHAPDGSLNQFTSKCIRLENGGADDPEPGDALIFTWTIDQVLSDADTNIGFYFNFIRDTNNSQPDLRGSCRLEYTGE